MITVISIDKKAVLKEHSVKSVEPEALSRKAGFKSPDGFEVRATWDCEVGGKKFCIKLYAKNNGRANYENKYDLPPPVDTQLYFGTMVLVNYEGDNAKNLSLAEWNKIYEHLFGGFEDIGSEDSEESVSEDEENLTKEGYLMDGFVVPDDELSEEEYI